MTDQIEIVVTIGKEGVLCCCMQFICTLLNGYRCVSWGGGWCCIQQHNTTQHTLFTYCNNNFNLICLNNTKILHSNKVKKGKCTLVQAMSLCTGRTARRRSRGIALLFLDHGTRRGEGSASRPGRFLPPGKTRYPSYRRLGGSQGRSGQVRKISPPPGFDPRAVQPVASR